MEKEKKKRHKTHRFIVAKKNILKGTKISLKDLAFKRSLKKIKKIEPKDYTKILGKTAKKNIKVDQILSKKNFI